MSATAAASENSRRTRRGTTFAMPQIVPAPPSARARGISTSAPTSAPTSGAARRKPRNVSKSPLLSFTPETSAP